jgi:hypothetical protein
MDKRPPNQADPDPNAKKADPCGSGSLTETFLLQNKNFLKLLLTWLPSEE